MRIAIFSDNFYPELSGIPDVMLTCAKALAKQGHFVDFYAPYATRKNYEKSGLPFCELEMGENVKVYRYSSLPFPSPTQQSRLVIPTGLRWVTLLKHKPDIIHSHTFFGTGLEALITAKVLNIPFIGTNHTAITEYSQYAPFKKDVFEKYSIRFLSWYYNHCDYIVSPSERILREMEQHGLLKPHSVISNPLDKELFFFEPEKKSVLKSKLGFSPHTIIFAGRFAAEKKIDVTIKAVALVKKTILDIQFVLAGHGSEEDHYKMLINELGLEENIKFVGTLSKQDLSEAYRASDLFVIASTSEIQSTSFMQAMACGLPVVAARSRFGRTYSEDSNLLVNADDPESLALSMVRLFNDPILYESMQKSVLTQIEPFSTDAIVKDWEKVYQQTIALAGVPKKRKRILPKVALWSLRSILIGVMLGFYTLFMVIEFYPTSTYASTLQKQPTLTSKAKFTYHYLTEDNDDNLKAAK